RTFSARNLLPDILNNARAFLERFYREEALPSNPRRTHTDLNVHRVTFLLAHVLLITGTEEMVCHTTLHTTRSTTDGFPFPYNVPGSGNTEYCHWMCCG